MSEVNRLPITTISSMVRITENSAKYLRRPGKQLCNIRFNIPSASSAVVFIVSASGTLYMSSSNFFRQPSLCCSLSRQIKIRHMY